MSYVCTVFCLQCSSSSTMACNEPEPLRRFPLLLDSLKEKCRYELLKVYIMHKRSEKCQKTKYSKDRLLQRTPFSLTSSYLKKTYKAENFKKNFYGQSKLLLLPWALQSTDYAIPFVPGSLCTGL